MLIHVVRQGDTLWSLADYYKTDIVSIMEANGLTNPNQLLVGQSLLIPEEQETYMVKPGDTIWKISSALGVPAQDLLWENQILNPDNIYVGQILRIPEAPKPEIEVNGFSYFFDQEGMEVVSETGNLLTFFSPFGYLVNEDGSLVSIDDAPLIGEAISHGVIPMMAIVNFTVNVAGENIANKVLNNPDTVNILLDNIIDEMKEKGYLGLNVDFEYVLPEDREAYNNFLRAAAERLHNEGFFISTSLAPKLSADQEGLLYEAHDYPAHGEIADFVVLMTYEWGWRGGQPRAISPINEIRRVLDYAVTVIPRDKILMGFQIYARDWKIPFAEGDEAETISVEEAMERAYAHNAEIQYDNLAQSPFFSYTDEDGNSHIVWFEDARSAEAKFDTVKDYDLRGLSYWGLGYPFTQNWVLLQDTFDIKKY
ncbi:LysM peptidoglycan-binding domain-containing protein [Sedimentibacter sp.]|uniref:glycoside hydrolase family 18 protein n=1 Tax=Sedimentibacter sp. TaxID=1960295 RepID=UPI00289F92E8|nr:LysM peptidoglycan-binding domain-containing protein [Sedimentibacter sp.]